MIQGGYLRTFVVSFAVFFVLLLGFNWIIDPYGVSPLQLNLPGINARKPKRLDIDRLIKPYEVWRYQPRTVFLGTSRIHQSIDPAVLDATRFAPAYNASIPASTLSENAAHLEQFFRIDSKLRIVVVELWLYNFAVRPQFHANASHALLEDAASLLLNPGSVFDALQTLTFNLSGRPGRAYVAAGGYRVNAADFVTPFSPQAFIDSTMRTFSENPPTSQQSAAFAALDRIVEICRRNNAELYLFITPRYPWDDYRLLSLGYWSLLEDWLVKISAYPNVISFSQYNGPLDEPPAPIMKYWNDPTHFNVDAGRLMLKAFLETSSSASPSNLLRVVTADTVEEILHEHRAGLNNWVARNAPFTTAFDRAKLLTRDDRSTGR
jgi:hypothetical protein